MMAAAFGALSNGYVVMLHATVFLGGVALALPAAHRAGPEARARTYAAALLGMLVVSLLCWLPVGAWWARAVPAFAAAPLVTLGAAGIAAQTGAGSPTVLTAARVLLAIWIGGAALVMARWGEAWLRVRALSRRATPVRDRTWERELREACSTMGTHQGIALRVSDEIATPLTWGTLDPMILLPADAHTWPPERRRMALLHELAHVRRGDCLLQVIAQAACAWYWFHPGAWWAMRGLHAAREDACDARVLAAGVRPSAYAQCLLDVADRARAYGRTTDPAAVPMARAPRLDARVRRVLAPAPAPATHGRTARWLPQGAAVAVVAWALLLGTVRFAPQRAVLWTALRSDAWSERAYAAVVLGRSRFPSVRDELRARANHDPHPVVRRLVRAAR